MVVDVNNNNRSSSSSNTGTCRVCRRLHLGQQGGKLVTFILYCRRTEKVRKKEQRTESKRPTNDSSKGKKNTKRNGTTTFS